MLRPKNWRGNRFIWRPSGIKTTHESIFFDSGNFGGFNARHFFSINFYKTICSFISLVFFVCFPLAILRRIRAIVIYSSNSPTARLFRFWPHILIKCFKRFTPSPTNTNASSAIVLPAWVFRIGTSLNHVIPRLIFSRQTKAVLGRAFILCGKTLFHFASATTSMSRTESANFTVNDITAITSASVYGFSVWRLANIFFDNNKTINADTKHRFCFWRHFYFSFSRLCQMGAIKSSGQHLCLQA